MEETSIENMIESTKPFPRTELNYFNEFKDNETYENYIKHRTKRLSFHAVCLIALSALVYAVPTGVVTLASDIMYGSSYWQVLIPKLVTSIINLLASISMAYCSIIMLWMRLKSRRKAQSIICHEADNSSLNNNTQTLYYHTNIIYIGALIYFNMSFLRRCLSYDCFSNEYYLVSHNCDNNSINSLSSSLALDTIGLLVTPILLFVGLSNASIKLVFFYFFIALINLYVVGILCGLILPEVALQFSIISIFCFIGILDLQYSRILDFVYFREAIQLSGKMHTIKEESEAVFREEMRILVGNVAHDIKSVSLNTTHFCFVFLSLFS